MAVRSTTFRTLDIGQSFDFVNTDEPQTVSFWDRCEKTGRATYRSLSTNFKYRVGSLDVKVFNMGTQMPIHAKGWPKK